MNRYLLEIGTEEIPAAEIGHALKQLKDNAIKMLKENRISFEEIKVYSTPRRIALFIDGIDSEQKTLREMAKGPAKKIAFDENGSPTKALVGFMKGKGVNLEDVEIKEVKGIEYVYAEVVEEGLSTIEVLKKEIPSLIKSISFNKSMKWGGKNLRFSRPIRWIVSLFNTEVVLFELEGIEVSNITNGHRFLGNKNIKIPSVDEYEGILRENYCILNQNERKDIIRLNSERLVKEKGGNLAIGEDLLDEVTNIVEYPTPAIGRIKDQYLELPKDVVITPMKEHLRFFPVVDDNDNLLPYFITVRNGNSEYIDTVIKGNEKVLGARLEDAIFFYHEDIKKPLEEYVEDLKNIVFQEKLGTVYDKTIRISKLSEKISDYLEVGDQTKDNLKRASYLSKADLVTQMVDEFSELQGKMGMEYASQAGENEIVSISIFEQYLPRFAGDKLPTTTAGAILSIADKFDTIAGSFAIGLKPTSSQDPYGLRRQALGIINIILDKNLSLNISDVIDSALYLYVEENGLVIDYDKVKEEIMEFFEGRLKNIFIESESIRYDLVDAILGSGIKDIYDISLRAKKINELLQKGELVDVLDTFNRVITLAKKAESTDIDEELFEESEEIELYNAFISIKDEYNSLIDKKQYDEALLLIVKLKKPVDSFFDNVMVMVEDESIKENRLSLLGTISDNMLKVCDLSKLVK